MDYKKEDIPELFPAYAGVIPIPAEDRVGWIAFPRLRGGDPEQVKSALPPEVFSPPTRG